MWFYLTEQTDEISDDVKSVKTVAEYLEAIIKLT